MLQKVAWRGLSTHARCYSSKALRAVPTLPDATVDTFRQHAFEPAVPALLPKEYQLDMPAVTKWFEQTTSRREASLENKLFLTMYRIDYLSTWRSASLPMEITNNGEFVRIENTMGFFLDFVYASDSTFRQEKQSFYGVTAGTESSKQRTGANTPPSAHPVSTAKIYIAQASLSDLPRLMRADLPTPEVVLKAGKGDIYDSSIWLGQAPTYTPLHRDPNPNLFVQLGGKKIVRLYAPRVGNAVFSKVQEQIGGSSSATMRGEEMMQGKEKELLENEVWSDSQDTIDGAWQAELDAGDALFIPKGWWHSVKGVGDDMNGSVNWWFR